MATLETCKWVVQPDSGNWNKVKVKFQWIELGEGDLIQIYDTESGLEHRISFADGHTVPDLSFGSKGFWMTLKTGNTINSRGFWLTYETKLEKNGISSKTVALAVTFCVLGAVAIGIGATVFVMWIKASSIRMANTPAVIWVGEEEERKSLGGGSESASLLPLVSIDKCNLDFNLVKAGTCPVGEELFDTVVITNRHSWMPIYYKAFVPDGGSNFSFDLRPGSGYIAAGKSVALNIRFKLFYTRRVSRAIKIEISGPRMPKQTHILRFNIEGSISDKLDPEEITLDTKIGSGGFGTVYRGMYRGRLMAVKVQRKQHGLSPEQIAEFHGEIDIYRRLRSPFVVEFIGASFVPGKICMCVELMELGTLEDFIDKNEIPIQLQYRFAMNIAEALHFLHKNNVLYRDLKPSNILVASTSLSAKVNCKISDFGTARNVRDVSQIYNYTSGMGTPLFMAPELFMRAPYNNKVDVFAYAITLWRVASRCDNWNGASAWDVPQLVKAGKRPDLPRECPEPYAVLISKCWAQEPNDRPEFTDILDELSHLTGIKRQPKVLEAAAPQAVARLLEKEAPPPRTVEQPNLLVQTLAFMTMRDFTIRGQDPKRGVNC